MQNTSLSSSPSPTKDGDSPRQGRRIRSPSVRYADDMILFPFKSPRKSKDTLKYSPNANDATVSSVEKVSELDKAAFKSQKKMSRRETSKSAASCQTSQLYSLLTGEIKPLKAANSNSPDKPKLANSAVNENKSVTSENCDNNLDDDGLGISNKILESRAVRVLEFQDKNVSRDKNSFKPATEAETCLVKEVSGVTFSNSPEKSSAKTPPIKSSTKGIKIKVSQSASKFTDNVCEKKDTDPNDLPNKLNSAKSPIKSLPPKSPRKSKSPSPTKRKDEKSTTKNSKKKSPVKKTPNKTDLSNSGDLPGSKSDLFDIVYNEDGAGKSKIAAANRDTSCKEASNNFENVINCDKENNIVYEGMETNVIKVNSINTKMENTQENRVEGLFGLIAKLESNLNSGTKLPLLLTDTPFYDSVMINEEYISDDENVDTPSASTNSLNDFNEKENYDSELLSVKEKDSYSSLVEECAKKSNETENSASDKNDKILFEKPITSPDVILVDSATSSSTDEISNVDNVKVMKKETTDFEQKSNSSDANVCPPDSTTNAVDSTVESKYVGSTDETEDSKGGDSFGSRNIFDVFMTSCVSPSKVGPKKEGEPEASVKKESENFSDKISGIKAEKSDLNSPIKKVVSKVQDTDKKDKKELSVENDDVLIVKVDKKNENEDKTMLDVKSSVIDKSSVVEKIQKKLKSAHQDTMSPSSKTIVKEDIVYDLTDDSDLIFVQTENVESGKMPRKVVSKLAESESLSSKTQIKKASQRQTIEPAPLDVLMKVQMCNTNNMAAFTSENLDKFLKSVKNDEFSTDVKSEVVDHVNEASNEESGEMELLPEFDPDFDEVDGLLFMSFASEDALSAHVHVEQKTNIGKNENLLLGMSRIKRLRQQQRQLPVSFHSKFSRLKKLKLQSKINQNLQGMHKALAKYQRLYRLQLEKMFTEKGQKLPVRPVVKPLQKTSDITKIKGWKNKYGNTEEFAEATGLPLTKSGKFHWRTEERLLKNLNSKELKEIGLNLKKKRRKNLIFTVRKGMSKGDNGRSDKSFSSYDESSKVYDEDDDEEEDEVETKTDDEDMNDDYWFPKYDELSEKGKKGESKMDQAKQRLAVKRLNLSPEEVEIIKKLGGAKTKLETPKESGLGTYLSPSGRVVKRRKKRRKIIHLTTLTHSMALAALSTIDPKFVKPKPKTEPVRTRASDVICLSDSPKRDEEVDGVFKSWDNMPDVDSMKSCDKPGCRYGCICHLCRFGDQSSDPENSGKSRPPSCDKEYCRLGCICDSIEAKREKRRLSAHCGKPDCMFQCKCSKSDDLKKQLFSSNSSHSDPNDSVNQSEQVAEEIIPSLHSQDSNVSEDVQDESKKNRKGWKQKSSQDIPQRKSTYRLAKNLDAISRKAMLLYETSEMYTEMKVRKRKNRDSVDGLPVVPAQASSKPVSSDSTVTAMNKSNTTRSKSPGSSNNGPSKKSAAWMSSFQPCSVSSNGSKDAHSCMADVKEEPMEWEKPSAAVCKLSVWTYFGFPVSYNEGKWTIVENETLCRLCYTKGISLDDESDLDEYREYTSCARTTVYNPVKRLSKKCTCSDEKHQHQHGQTTNAKTQPSGDASSPLIISPVSSRPTTPEPTPTPVPVQKEQDQQRPSAEEKETLQPNTETQNNVDLRIPIPRPHAIWHTQWVCLKANKKKFEEEGRPFEEVRLLEINSNCNWEISKQKILSRISAQLSKEGYPSPKRIQVEDFYIEFLPKSNKPAMIPVEVRAKLPVSIYSVRINIIKAFSLSDVSQPSEVDVKKLQHFIQEQEQILTNINTRVSVPPANEAGSSYDTSCVQPSFKPFRINQPSRLPLRVQVSEAQGQATVSPNTPELQKEKTSPLGIPSGGISGFSRLQINSVGQQNMTSLLPRGITPVNLHLATASKSFKLKPGITVTPESKCLTLANSRGVLDIPIKQVSIQQSAGNVSSSNAGSNAGGKVTYIGSIKVANSSSSTITSSVAVLQQSTAIASTTVVSTAGLKSSTEVSPSKVDSSKIKAGPSVFHLSPSLEERAKLSLSPKIGIETKSTVIKESSGGISIIPTSTVSNKDTKVTNPRIEGLRQGLQNILKCSVQETQKLVKLQTDTDKLISQPASAQPVEGKVAVGKPSVSVPVTIYGPFDSPVNLPSSFSNVKLLKAQPVKSGNSPVIHLVPVSPASHSGQPRFATQIVMPNNSPRLPTMTRIVSSTTNLTRSSTTSSSTTQPASRELIAVPVSLTPMGMKPLSNASSFIPLKQVTSAPTITIPATSRVKTPPDILPKVTSSFSITNVTKPVGVTQLGQGSASNSKMDGQAPKVKVNKVSMQTTDGSKFLLVSDNSVENSDVNEKEKKKKKKKKQNGDGNIQSNEIEGKKKKKIGKKKDGDNKPEEYNVKKKKGKKKKSDNGEKGSVNNGTEKGEDTVVSEVTDGIENEDKGLSVEAGSVLESVSNCSEIACETKDCKVYKEKCRDEPPSKRCKLDDKTIKERTKDTSSINDSESHSQVVVIDEDKLLLTDKLPCQTNKSPGDENTFGVNIKKVEVSRNLTDNMCISSSVNCKSAGDEKLACLENEFVVDSDNDEMDTFDEIDSMKSSDSSLLASKNLLQSVEKGAAEIRNIVQNLDSSINKGNGKLNEGSYKNECSKKDRKQVLDTRNNAHQSHINSIENYGDDSSSSQTSHCDIAQSLNVVKKIKTISDTVESEPNKCSKVMPEALCDSRTNIEELCSTGAKNEMLKSVGSRNEHLKSSVEKDKNRLQDDPASSETDNSLVIDISDDELHNIDKEQRDRQNLEQNLANLSAMKNMDCNVEIGKKDSANTNSVQLCENTVSNSACEQNRYPGAKFNEKADVLNKNVDNDIISDGWREISDLGAVISITEEDVISSEKSDTVEMVDKNISKNVSNGKTSSKDFSPNKSEDESDGVEIITFEPEVNKSLEILEKNTDSWKMSLNADNNSVSKTFKSDNDGNESDGVEIITFDPDVEISGEKLEKNIGSQKTLPVVKNNSSSKHLTQYNDGDESDGVEIINFDTDMNKTAERLAGNAASQKLSGSRKRKSAHVVREELPSPKVLKKKRDSTDRVVSPVLHGLDSDGESASIIDDDCDDDDEDNVDIINLSDDEDVDIETITDADNMYNQLRSQAADNPESLHVHSYSCSVHSLQNKRKRKSQLELIHNVLQDDVEYKEGNVWVPIEPRTDAEKWDYDNRQETRKKIIERQRRYDLSRTFRELSRLTFTKEELQMACDNKGLPKIKILDKAIESIRSLERTYERNKTETKMYMNKNSELKHRLYKLQALLRSSGVSEAVIQGSLQKAAFVCQKLFEVDSLKQKIKQTELEMEGKTGIGFGEMEVPVKLVPVQSSNRTSLPLSIFQKNQTSSSSLISNKSQTHVVSSKTILGHSPRPVQLVSSQEVKQMALTNLVEQDPPDVLNEVSGEPDIYIDHAEDDCEEGMKIELPCKEEVKTELTCENRLSDIGDLPGFVLNSEKLSNNVYEGDNIGNLIERNTSGHKTPLKKKENFRVSSTFAHILDEITGEIIRVEKADEDSQQGEQTADEDSQQSEQTADEDSQQIELPNSSLVEEHYKSKDDNCVHYESSSHSQEVADLLAGEDITKRFGDSGSKDSFASQENPSHRISTEDNDIDEDETALVISEIKSLAADSGPS